MKDIRNLSVSGIVLLIIIFGLSSSVAAAIKQFMPRIFDYRGELEIDTTYSSEENESDGRGLSREDIFARERFNLYITGYSFHPRFIWYSLKLSTGLKEENYKSGIVESGWTTGTSWGYDFTMFVLPEHPYNLEIFFRRYEPLSRQALSRQSPSVGYSKGAIFRYKRKPYFLDLSYTDSTTEAAGSTYDTTSYRGNGSYYKEYIGGKLLVFSASYDHRETGSSVSSFQSSSNEYALSNSISLKHLHFFGTFLENVALSSAVRYSAIEQSGENVSINDDIFAWNEGIRASLPWNFDTSLSFNYADSRTNFDVSPAPATETSSTNTVFSWDVGYKFYKSIYTRYSFRTSNQDTDTGGSKTTSNTLGVNYTKNIPWGRLTASGSIGRSVSENEGSSLAVRDTHNGVDVPGPIIISSVLKIDVSTVTVFVRDPEPPDALVPLTENLNYILIEQGGDLRIEIISLPPRFPLPGVYDFIVFYSQAARNVELETKSRSYGISATLFGDIVRPYYSHSSSSQTELSGSLEGEPLDLSIDLYGLNVAVSPFTFLIEYTDVKANIAPYRLWRTELRYFKNISPTIRLQAKTRYSSKYYPSSTLRERESYTDKIYGLDFGVTKRFPKRNMALSFNGSYSQSEGLTRSKIYAASTFFSWKTRKLLLTTGASLSTVKSEFDGIKTDRISQYYFLQIKRELF